MEAFSEQCPDCGDEHASLALATRPGTVVCLNCGRPWTPSVLEYRRREQVAKARLERERKKLEQGET